MHESVERCDTLFWVPLEALADEVVEGVTLAHQDLVQRLRARNAQSILGVGSELWLIGLRIKEVIFSCGASEKTVIR